MIELYTSSTPNGWKASVTLEELEIPYNVNAINLGKLTQKEEWFLKLNPNGRIPVLETAEGRRLAESNAILFYLAEGTAFLPEEGWERAEVLQWMFFEQYSHEPNIATSRSWLNHGDLTPERRAGLEQKRPLGYAALGVMEGHLEERAFFVAERYSIADIALFAYTHVADEGGFDLAPYPAIKAWLERVRSQPGHIPITQG